MRAAGQFLIADEIRFGAVLSGTIAVAVDAELNDAGLVGELSLSISSPANPENVP